MRGGVGNLPPARFRDGPKAIRCVRMHDPAAPALFELRSILRHRIRQNARKLRVTATLANVARYAG